MRKWTEHSRKNGPSWSPEKKTATGTQLSFQLLPSVLMVQGRGQNPRDPPYTRAAWTVPSHGEGHEKQALVAGLFPDSPCDTPAHGFPVPACGGGWFFPSWNDTPCSRFRDHRGLQRRGHASGEPGSPGREQEGDEVSQGKRCPWVGFLTGDSHRLSQNIPQPHL